MAPDPKKVNELVHRLRALGFSIMADEHSVTPVVKRNRAEFDRVRATATEEEWRAALKEVGDRTPGQEWDRNRGGGW